MSLPLVSAICPTYNRYPLFGHLLDEAVYWFTRQDYPNKELVVLNDCGAQRLECDVPGVRVINFEDKYPTLGDKYNGLLDLARGDVILPWEDDDVSLPRRMSQAVDRLYGAPVWTITTAPPAFDYFNPQHSWWENAGELHTDHSHGVCQNASGFRAGKFRFRPVNGNQDALFDADAKRQGRVAPALTPDPRSWTYVYRWGVSDYHLSGFGNMDAAYRDPRRVVPGVYRIVPRPTRDYAALCSL